MTLMLERGRTRKGRRGKFFDPGTMECLACGCGHHSEHHGCGYVLERAWIECDECECWMCDLFRDFTITVDEWGLLEVLMATRCDNQPCPNDGRVLQVEVTTPGERPVKMKLCGSCRQLYREQDQKVRVVR